MPWFKIDDAFHCHPKVLAAGNGACGLFVRFGSYCAQQLTDGVIPRSIARQYGTRSELKRLLDLHLIEPHADDFVIPDYLDYNPSATDIRNLRNTRSEAGRAGGLASGASRQTKPVNKANSEPIASRLLEAKTNPIPSHPIPSQSLHVDTSSSVTDTPTKQTTDDDYQQVITLIVEAKEQEWGDRLTKPRAWRHKVHVNTHLEDGALIRRLLDEGTPPADTALFVLGHGLVAQKERTETNWCKPDCPQCAGDGYISQTDNTGHRHAAPCPNRATA